MQFNEPLESDAEVHRVGNGFSGGIFEDLEGQMIEMLGVEYEILQAGLLNQLDDTAAITLVAGVKHTLQEGQEQQFLVNGHEYDVEVVSVGEDSATLRINGNKHVFQKGIVGFFQVPNAEKVSVSEILFQDYAGGVHSVSFYLGSKIISLLDSDITDNSGDQELKSDLESIEGTLVTIQGRFANDDVFIEEISVKMEAQDDYFVPRGERLSQNPSLDEPGLLFTENWDLMFTGITEEKTTTISVLLSADESGYEMTFTNILGQEITFPLAYASGGQNLLFGDRDDSLVLENLEIADEQYFILNSARRGDSVTHVVQYKGADNMFKTGPKAKFRILASGKTVEREIAYKNGRASFTLKLGGTTYEIESLGSTEEDDFNIRVGGGVVTSQRRGNIIENRLFGFGGSKIVLKGPSEPNNGVNTVEFDVTWANQAYQTNRFAHVFGASITASAGEVDFIELEGITLHSSDNDDANANGWSSYGAFVTHTSPSGGAGSADTVTIEYPENQRFAQVRILGNTQAE
ncbi:TPA: hypothetical protein HA278_00815 [Candidatus Woesearchaeota archaeon]|nr:hypothetical protein [archaeon]HIJ10572.1 hypothetical protein [Candidatus Woesearchaeota archaeon]